MFTRRPVFHPYKPSTPRSSPAGIRIADYVNHRRCFFQGPDFTNTRSPDPSPLNSPTRGSPHPEDNAPPTLRLADLIAGNGPESPLRPSTPCPDNHPPKLNAKPAPIPDSPRRNDRRGPKLISFSRSANGSGILSPHRRSQRIIDRRDARKRVLDRHERRIVRAREGLRNLRTEAEGLMKPEHMNNEDKIFLEQLAKLELDQTLEHDLEHCRQRMARAAAQAPQRQQEHVKRDKEAARLWRTRQDADALKKREKRVADFVQEKESRMEARFRRMEEAAIRADEKRQRVHETRERQIREKQERIFREEIERKAKQEAARRKREEEERRLQEERERQVREAMERMLRKERERQLREEMERKLQEQRARKSREEQLRRFRESHEQFMREGRERAARAERERLAGEERERLAKERERLDREERERIAKEERERARRTAQEEAQAIDRHFFLYEGKWNELRTSDSLPPIDVRDMPWPVFGVISSADQITYKDVRTFLLHPRRPNVEGKTARDKIKSEVLRFHPDKFNMRILSKVHPHQHAVAQAIAGAVARILTGMMTEEVEHA